MGNKIVKRKKFLQSMHHYQRPIYGVDFSGAANAGKRIWISSGVSCHGILYIKNCQQAETLLDSGNKRNKCMAALRDFIQQEPACVFGFDFPFGLPRNLIKEYNSWKSFVLSFPRRYSSAEEFRKSLYTVAGKTERKRITDKERKTPFSPYNLRLYRQTYFGILEILAPLVKNRTVCVLPMQKAWPQKTWLLEVCPASTLKQGDMYLCYKGHTKSHFRARISILKWVEEVYKVSLPKTIRSTVLEDPYGDALDSLIAASATHRTLRNHTLVPSPDNSTYLLEGYVYV
ncbi:MAG: DUF429 domain-containing protein [wastewater metagenome]|nr:DUF429 domain-containing protein [Candidatus Loosdrechtia aerotolerans]